MPPVDLAVDLEHLVLPAEVPLVDSPASQEETATVDRAVKVVDMEVDREVQDTMDTMAMDAMLVNRLHPQLCGRCCRFVWD